MPRKGQIKASTLDKVKETLRDKGLELLEYNGVNYPMKVFCKVHGEIEMRTTNGCKRCANERISKKYRLRAIEQLKSKLDFQTELIEESYVRSTKPALFICKEHSKEYFQAPRDYVAGWRGCPICRRTSIPESEIISILENLNIEYEHQKTFETCVNPETGRKLPFDFYIPTQNLLIEYDGEQHFMPIGKFDEGLEVRQQYDQYKTDWAQKSRIRLVRIPYWKKDRLESLIAKTLRQ